MTVRLLEERESRRQSGNRCGDWDRRARSSAAKDKRGTAIPAHAVLERRGRLQLRSRHRMGRTWLLADGGVKEEKERGGRWGERKIR
jgi:hypothetical protein